MARLNLIQTGGGGGTSGTLPLTIAEVAHNWLDSYNSTTGLFTQSQPAAADIAVGTFVTGMTFVAPVLGTPASGTLTSCIGLPAAAIVAGTMATGMTLVAPLLGTPASGVLSSCTGYPWSSLANAEAALTLANGTNATTFNQTSAVAWTYANTTPTVTGAITTLAISSVSTTTGVTTYTIATETGAGSNGWVGASIIVSGFTSPDTGNNGTFTVTASTTTTVVVTNASGTSGHAGTGVMKSSAVVGSPIINLSGTINSGTAGTLNSIADTWTVQSVPASVVPNPVSVLTFGHSGSTGYTQIQFPTPTSGGTSGIPQICSAVASTIGIVVAPSTNQCLQTVATSGARYVLQHYAGTATVFQIYADDSNAVCQVANQLSAGTLNLGGGSAVVGTASIAAVSLGSTGAWATTGAGPYIGVNMGSKAYAGNISNVSMQLNWAPTAGAGNFYAALISPTINQSSTASGSYTALRIAVTETALLGSSNKLIDCYAGSAGTTEVFAVDNSGKVTEYAGTATVSQGIPSEIATVDLTAQSGAIAATNITASAPATGMYRVSWSADITTAGTTSVLGGTAGF